MRNMAARYLRSGYNDRDGNVARIILRKRNLSRNIVSNHVLIRSRSDEKNVSEEFVSGLEVTLSEAKKYNLFFLNIRKRR